LGLSQISPHLSTPRVQLQIFPQRLQNIPYPELTPWHQMFHVRPTSSPNPSKSLGLVEYPARTC
jgi:hypothetical protein